jgi:hypothetical protein
MCYSQACPVDTSDRERGGESLSALNIKFCAGQAIRYVSHVNISGINGTICRVFEN